MSGEARFVPCVCCCLASRSPGLLVRWLQGYIASMELQEAVQTPDMERLGLALERDPRTGKPRLVQQRHIPQ